nr:hypothetical protein KS05_07955 [Rhizobium brockwellii]
MFIKSHDSFAFLAFGSTRYSAAKPQRLLLIGRTQARKRSETVESGDTGGWNASVPNDFPEETGPPFSHQPEDRVNEQGGLYGFFRQRQAQSDTRTRCRAMVGIGQARNK